MVVRSKTEQLIFEREVSDKLWTIVSTDKEHFDVLSNMDFDYDKVNELIEDTLFEYMKVHAYVYGNDVRLVEGVNLDSVSCCTDTFNEMQSVMNLLFLKSMDFIGAVHVLGEYTNEDKMDRVMMLDGVNGLFGENFEYAVTYKEQ